MIRRWGDVVSGSGTVILSLLSCMFCPMCLPFYGGLLSVIGVELIDFHAFFFPITLGFGGLTLAFMAYQIYTHHASWIAFKLALGAVVGMAAAAFFDFEYLLYAFLISFMGCILWNKRQLIHQGHKCC